MAIYKVIDAEKLDADLKSVADKIREKGGITEELTFPRGFNDAVDAISTSIDGKNKVAQIAEGSITELTADDMAGVINICPYAFQYCESLINLSVPDSVEDIGMFAFANCTNLANVNISNGVKSIRDSAFYFCKNLTSIIIPDSVTTIEWYVFYNCTSLASVIIGNNVTGIWDSAFRKCTSLTNVTFPRSVTYIGYSAFSECTNLVTIKILAETPPVIATNTFASTVKKIIVPAGCRDTYKTATNWANYADIIEEATE